MTDSDQSPANLGAGFTNENAVLTGGTRDSGCYTVMVQADGTGYSTFSSRESQTALTAWSAVGGTCREGLVFFLRDLERGTFWSVGADPAKRHAHRSPGCFTITDTQEGLTATLETFLVEGRTAEMRVLTLTNGGEAPRRLDVTSLAEVVLNDPGAHQAHPVFSKLFLQTQVLGDPSALLVSRRPRGAGETNPVLVHALIDSSSAEDITGETDRARFFGRGHDRNRPAAMLSGEALSGTVGNVLDPVVSLRQAVPLAPGQSATLVFMLGVAEDRPSALLLLEHCRKNPSALRQAAAKPASGEMKSQACTPPEMADAPQACVPAMTCLRSEDKSEARTPPEQSPLEGLAFANEYGGFDPATGEYLIAVGPGPDGGQHVPPRPWTNVLANERLGCLVSETGAGCLWYGNSREYRITPWFNDPLLDPHGDTLYLRDNQDGVFFSCLPGPAPQGERYTMAHGFGYSRCRRDPGTAELATETLLFVDRHQPVRCARVRITNGSDRTRELSLFSYQQLVLGRSPQHDGRFVITAPAFGGDGLVAQNPQAPTFGADVAFAAVVRSDPVTAVHVSGDGAAFLGPDRDPARPAALLQPTLEGGCGSNPAGCFALQADLKLAAGETAEILFLVGQEQDRARVDALVKTWSQPGHGDEAFAAVTDFWRRGLTAIQVQTPSPALDIMVNGRLAYQTLACRIWARTALYQSGGAFGFRDQLQDSLALMPLWPDLTRRQILLHAGHQFTEGDVLHWWHPPHDGGIRTRFADDLLWLPFGVIEYITATGDESILAEEAPYLEGPPLLPGQDEVFVHPAPSGKSAEVFAHCCLALDRSLTLGDHGLPLFGTGDWNDGMNRVGREGRGESVWMGFFLVTIIDGFVPLCTKRGDDARAAGYRAHRDKLVKALNAAGWDGQWYRRGYYDDGSPLGSRANTECRIDALAQAWSVLSGTAPPERARQAMDAVEQFLIDDDHRLIRLLTPPFVDSTHDPGYIKGYVAGVRENGGQYTHAALWVIRAMAKLGRRDRAAALLDLLNPILHTVTPEAVARYQVEPYVVAADVYGAAPHVGRGGWTWYTGSSGWMLRVALESVLGLRTDHDTLVIAPCVPDDWPQYTLTWQVPESAGTRYEIQVENPWGCSAQVVSVTLDDQPVAPAAGTARLPLHHDGKIHHIVVTLGPAQEA